VARGFLTMFVLASPGLSSLAAVGEVMPWDWRVGVLAGLPLAHALAVVALCACEGRRGAELERAAMRQSFDGRLEAVRKRQEGRQE
jgi:predicted Kef-type K+ transport protein